MADKTISELFTQPVFGNRAQLDDFTEAQRQLGWASIGKEYPKASQFSQLQNDNERRDKYLHAQISKVIQLHQSDYVPSESSDDLSNAIEYLIKSTANITLTKAAPSGEIAYFALENAPDGWLKANGAAVSRKEYANLFAVIGTKYGRGDGVTTFNVPDLRGQFIRSWNDGHNIDRGRTLGSYQEDSLQHHNHYLPTSSGGGDAQWTIPDHLWVATDGNAYPSDFSKTVAETFWEGSPGRSGKWSGETRPCNVALLACIKV